MATNLSPLSIQAVVTSTFTALVAAIVAGHLIPDACIATAILNMDATVVLASILAALEASVMILLLAQCNGFANLDLKQFEAGLSTNQQGVYAIILMRYGQFYEIYIGSSFGKDGLYNRIYKNHQNPSYRLKEPKKYLYLAMAKPGVTAHYLCLAIFQQREQKIVPLLLEAVLCSLFGSYDIPLYREIRSASLPVVDWKEGANRSDPLSYFSHTAKPKRDRLLKNALAGGAMPVIHTTSNSEYFRIGLCRIEITIPVIVGRRWGLAESPWVNTTGVVWGFKYR
ncbi:MAG: hypothetical protein Q9226_007941, partial [Calogaya cf. arnoldii]